MTGTSLGGLRNFLVAFNGGTASLAALEHAIVLSRRYEAHVTGILVHGRSQVSRSIPGWFPEHVEETIRATLAQRADVIREAFFDAVKNRVPEERRHWLEIGGDPDATVADYARMYDLTVIGQFEALPAADELALHPARIVQDSGRPVMVVPKAWRAKEPAGCAVIAWDGNRGITGTVAHALPLLAGASEIIVLTIDDGTLGTPLEGIDVYTMLERHGLRSSEVRLRKGDHRVSSEIIAFCDDRRAELLLMGLSGHGWIGRTTAGSVTAQVLEHSGIPVFLAH